MEPKRMAAPKSSMAAESGPVRVAFDVYDASYRMRADVDGTEVFRSTLQRLRDGGEARRDKIKKEVLSTASWPSGEEAKVAKHWSRIWKEALFWEHPVRATMSQARACSTGWHGSLPAKELARHGFVLRQEACSEEACEKLHDWVVEGGVKMESVPHLDAEGDRGVRSAFLLTRKEAEEHREQNGGKVAQGFVALPAAASEQLEKLEKELKEVAGMPQETKLLMEVLRTGSGLRPPGDWHGDVHANPVLAGCLVLSKTAVLTYFPDVDSEWGAGKHVAVTPAEARKLDIYAARKLRWDVVRASGSNGSEMVPCRSGSATAPGSGTPLGRTATGAASAGPRKSSSGDVNRAKYGTRPASGRGGVLYFDSTGPHCSPGRAVGDAAGERVVLYFSFAVRAWEGGRGEPIYAFKPKGAKAGTYLLAYDRRGEYTLEAKPPGGGVKGSKRKKDPLDVFRKKRSRKGKGGGAPAGGPGAEESEGAVSVEAAAAALRELVRQDP